ncbi:MAG: AAA family ATPase [Victivallales bacterium]
MQITRLIVKNYRTYLDLDLDLSIKPEQSIILIGGANGGGKTTLFNAICGALYGLNIPNAAVFRREVNAGELASGGDERDMEIKLEIHFTGKVLDQTQQYILSRSWVLIDDSVRLSVMLNLNGNIIRYGLATPSPERQNSEAQVAKIIKANLPRELSEYFLFDAMSAGQKLEESQLSRIIRENIENVMGFRKYLDLAKAAHRVQEVKASERLKAKAEREEYLRLTEEKRNATEMLGRMQDERRDCRAEIHSLAELVQELKKAQNQETLLKSRRDQFLGQKKEILDKESQYRMAVQDFIKELAVTIGLPQLTKNMRMEITQIVQTFDGDGSNGSAPLSPEAVTAMVDRIIEFVKARSPGTSLPQREDLIKAALGSTADTFTANPWAFLEKNELAALSDLIRLPRANPFVTMDIIRRELAASIPSLTKINKQIDDLAAQMAGKDFSTLKRYEEQEALEVQLTNEIEQLEADIKEKEKRIQRYDIQLQEEPDPKYEALCRLANYFELAADELLKAKKQQIELKMRDDLNIVLPTR